MADYKFTNSDGVPHLHEPEMVCIPLPEVSESEHDLDWYKKNLELVIKCNGKLQHDLFDAREEKEKLQTALEKKQNVLMERFFEIKRLKERITELENRFKWHKVDKDFADRPYEGEEVIVYNGKNMGMTELCEDVENGQFFAWFDCWEDATHWMYKPAPPKGNK